MSTLRALSHPSRRSVLLSGALLTPLVLAGCDDNTGEEGETSPGVPQPAVTMTPLEVDAAVQTDGPALRRRWGIVASETRPLAMIVDREQTGQTSVHAVTLDNPDGAEVPVDPLAAQIIVDGRGPTVRVLATKIVDDAYETTLLTSSDLVEWAEAAVTPALDRAIQVAADGLLLSEVIDHSIKIWELGDDGAAAALAPIPVPEEQEWTVTSAARSEDVILVLVSVQRPGISSTPGVVRSADGGETWSQPEFLLTTTTTDHATAVRAVAGGFVIIGWYEGGYDDESYTRVTAWFSENGTRFMAEAVPIPTFGLDNWSVGEHSVMSGSALEFVNFSIGESVVDASGEIHVAVHFWDDCRRATRSKDGSWHVTELDGYDSYVGAAIFDAVMDPSGMVALAEGRVHTRVPGGGKATAGLEYALPRGLSEENRTAGGPLTGFSRWSAAEAERTDSGFTSKKVHHAIPFVIADHGIGPAEGLPEDVLSWNALSTLHDESGVSIVSGYQWEEVDDSFIPVAAVSANVDGAWVPATGIAKDAISSVGELTAVDGTFYLPLKLESTEDEDRYEFFRSIVYSSSDGVVWEQLGSFDVEQWENVKPTHTSFERKWGGEVIAVTVIDDQIVGLGWCYENGEEVTAASFLLDGDVWKPRPVADAPDGSRLDAAFEIAGATIVCGELGGDAIQGTLDAEGVLTQTYRASGRESRGAACDLGDGALISHGWVSQPISSGTGGENATVGIGACVWTSPDGGKTWAATLIPEQDGRYPATQLVRDGEDVIVLVEALEGPLGFRIEGAKEQILAS